MSDMLNSPDQHLPRPHKARSGGPSTARVLNEMREEILRRVNVIQNWIDVANGKMPEQWDAALNPRGPGETSTEPPTRLTIEHILHANHVLLKRILPEYRPVEASSADAREPMSYEEAREKMASMIKNIVAARGGSIDEHGNITLPPRSADPSPAIAVDMDADTLPDAENGKAGPMPEAQPERNGGNHG